MKAIPAWVTYTVLRLLTIAVPLAILLLLRVPWIVAAVSSVIIGLCVSYIFLRKPRDAVSRDLYEARERRRSVRSGEAEEDAEDEALRRVRPARDVPPDDE